MAIFYNLSFGGAKRTVFEHVKGLKKLGHTVDVYTIDNSHDIFDPGSVADHEFRYDYNPREIHLPLIKRIRSDYNNFYTLKETHKKIAKDIDSKKYTIALVHTDTYTQAPYILRFLETKNVYFCLEPLRMVYEYSLRIPENWNFINKLYEAYTRSIRKKIDRENALAANYTTAISLFGRECMILSYDLYPKISYLGVDTKSFKPLAVKKKRQVLYIGQKLTLNGYHLAKKAMELIPQKIRPELKIVTMKKNNDERLSEKEVCKLYSESLVTLSLSTYDTFGLIPLESMACETPVIALNVAGYRETMSNKDIGFLTDFSPEEIAEKIIFFFQNPDVARAMGKNGRKWVEQNWTWEKHIKKLENLLIKFSQNKVIIP